MSSVVGPLPKDGTAPPMYLAKENRKALDAPGREPDAVPGRQTAQESASYQ
jgi:hypothetical protein